jgi:hypothetical protein
MADLVNADVIVVLQAVTELHTEMTMAQEQTFSSFSPEQLVPGLVSCLTREEVPEIMCKK